MRTHLILLAALSLGLWPGCRCDSAPAEPTVAPRSSAPQPPPKCPPQPDWAENAEDQDKLVAELLYQPELDSSRKGTGMRVYADGRVFAFDEAIFEMKDGKMTNRPIPGKWRQHKTVPAERVAELRALIAELDPAQITDWQNRKGVGKGHHINLRVGDAWVRSCFRSLDGSPGQKRAEEKIKKIMGEALDPKANEK